MLNSAFYNSLLHWPQKEEGTEKTALSQKTLASALGKNKARQGWGHVFEKYTGFRPNLQNKLNSKLENKDWSQIYKDHNLGISTETKRLDSDPVLKDMSKKYFKEKQNTFVDKLNTESQNDQRTAKFTGAAGLGGLGLGYLAHKTFSKPSQEFIKSAQEKGAFINPLSAIKPLAGNAARTAYGGAKNLLKDSWKGLSGIDKTLTVGLPLATTVPSLFNKQDQMGNSRANRIAGTSGNILGGIAGTGLGNQLAKKVTTKLPGFAGKALGLGASVAGGLTGSLLGEAAAKTPFKAFNSSPTQSYNTQPSTSAPQMSMPGQTVS